MGKNIFHPVLHEGRIGIPLDGELEDDDIGVLQELLLLFHIEVPARFIETVEREIGSQTFQCFQNGAVREGLIQVGMTGYNKNFCHGKDLLTGKCNKTHTIPIVTQGSKGKIKRRSVTVLMESFVQAAQAVSTQMTLSTGI
jgi:hypothetical protein